MAEVVQFEYDQLKQIGQRFADQAGNVRTQFDKISQQMEVLKNGAWVGPNADKFYEIMESQLLPATKRLSDALDKGREVTDQVAKLMQEAEEESKGYFPT